LNALQFGFDGTDGPRLGDVGALNCNRSMRAVGAALSATILVRAAIISVTLSAAKPIAAISVVTMVTVARQPSFR
jgi:hypothetical protein